MIARLKLYIKDSFLYVVARPIYKFLERIYDYLRLIVFKLFPVIGRRSYNAMQKQQYKKYTGSFNDSMQLCVGEFDAHESYPYEDYLLEEYSGPRGIALDFACGMGRMMSRFKPLFDVVDGVDLSAENIEYAEKYLLGKGYSNETFNLYESSGLGVNIGKLEHYDFIYSTIALQHISVYDIRLGIFKDLFEMLKPSGACCFQMGFGWDNGTHWFDNRFTARSTNAGADVCVPDENHLDAIKKDFENIGYQNIKFEMKLSPHPEKGNTYHPIWLFIHMSK
tara:strand:- start:118 stop:954 length:837 start_codon:yes stop_codon:yes gene_type:complete